MKKIYSTFIMSFLALAIASCSSDNSTPDLSAAEYFEQLQNTDNPFRLDNNYKTTTNKSIVLSAEIQDYKEYTYQWKVVEKDDIVKDSIIATTKKVNIVSFTPVVYKIEGIVKFQNHIVSQELTLEVSQNNTKLKRHITKVFDFMPSYGQFVNEMPKYEPGDTKQTMIKKVEMAIAKENGSMISLGGFGGYVEFGFDHTIENVAGERDFQILGNAFITGKNPQGEYVGSAEPGIILVGVDKNGNGVPDPDEWYEIAGSQYNKSSTIHNYEITIYKPSKELDQATGNIQEYIKWEDNQGNQGFKPKNSFHTQSYYPLWVNQQSITFTGTRLADNAKNVGTETEFWEQISYEYGYADNAPNTDQRSHIDIDWAVDKEGKPAKLRGIDFIRVYTGVNQEAGWLGEISTEVAGAIDLHIK
ncbi:cell surface protein [Myroides sp. LJL115]